jgi:hypothetical protein
LGHNFAIDLYPFEKFLLFNGLHLGRIQPQKYQRSQTLTPSRICLERNASAMSRTPEGGATKNLCGAVSSTCKPAVPKRQRKEMTINSKNRPRLDLGQQGASCHAGQQAKANRQPEQPDREEYGQE